ncbi:hypothetical protein [Aquipuribacter sp. MA13-6]|uniref:hypothetical protein n=1 Tax=unclassified Aquipuribacter TaxID=2635084 RepID=UPI003EEB3957
MIVLIGLPLWFGLVWGATGDRPAVGWQTLVVFSVLAPVLTVFLAMVPVTFWNLPPAVLVWRRLWRSVRLSRPSARRSWEARYGHTQTLNAWDLWGATDPIGAISDTDEALRRERADRKDARREQRRDGRR